MKTIKRRCLDILARGNTHTAVELAKLTGSKWETTSSLLLKLCKEGVLTRVPDYGVRKGYGYKLAQPKTPDHIMFGDDEHGFRGLCGKCGDTYYRGDLKGWDWLEAVRGWVAKHKTCKTPRSDNPYSEYDCPSCGENRNGYENHHCKPARPTPPKPREIREGEVPPKKKHLVGGDQEERKCAGCVYTFVASGKSAERYCPSCRRNKDKYGRHCDHPRMVCGPNGGSCPDCPYAYDI